VDDLHAALNAGSIPGPYVLVGHSLGGIEARLYAQRWPKEVVGMVLVDTASAGEGLIDENQPGYDEVIGGESYAADMLHCAFLVADGPLEPSRPEYNDCSSASALPSDTPTAFRKAWPQFFTAYYFAAATRSRSCRRCTRTGTTASITATLRNAPGRTVD
jgi:pimeloyl-ACP methyl ester carboxylesterase